MFFQLNVFFKSLSVETVAESAEYTWQSFLSTLGGARSLWLGITFLQIFEVIELGARFMYESFNQSKMK